MNNIKINEYFVPIKKQHNKKIKIKKPGSTGRFMKKLGGKKKWK